ncbi:MAG TPA: type II toxin-antitoxin system VapC family toxin [Anaerolineales bacterium]|nr:type II toxin-antitoxin system VapC family toxin [Anaerolineales bacterium]
MTETIAYVLDSFALLAYLQDEPVAVRIERLLDNAGKEKCRLFLSIINLGELLYITERRGSVAKAQDALALVRQLPIQVMPADEQLVFAAAHIKANHPLSFADAFVVAIAVQENASILTGDPEFQSVESLVTVEWLKLGA